MNVKKIVLLVFLVVSGSSFSMVTPRVLSDAGGSSAPSTPPRHVPAVAPNSRQSTPVRNSVSGDTGGLKSVPPSPERDGWDDENVVLDIDHLGIQLDQLMHDQEVQLDVLMRRNDALMAAAQQVYPRYFSPSLWTRCKNAIVNLGSKRSAPTNYFMAYMVTEILCEFKKTFHYRSEGDVCKTNGELFDSAEVTRCAQRIVSGLSVAFLKGFFATVAAKKGVKTLLAVHLLMQSGEALIDYLGLSQHFDHDLKCYKLRLLIPGMLILLKEMILMSRQEVAYLLG
ncbi:hypothetical protein FJ366_03305 [Candidatus Dependentiae bacterium]|nr:hypothetical protein [Candidatus Dependentiae bacterium]